MIGKPDFSILITDDDQGFRQSLRGVFAERGFRTLEASSGEEAIEIVQDAEVHLALLDMYMPRLSGLETLRIVKQIKAFLPCIILSADADERLMHEALSARAFTVLAKPISHHVVIHTVFRALRQSYPEPDDLGPRGRWHERA
ncbi:MAG: response regulator [Planctomycetes bacterium]|nr:response regulator [Planctomycetota bacterium]